MKYRKKPVVIEAVQWTGNLIEIQEFCPTAKVKLLDDSAWKVGIAPPVIKVVIPTLEGDMEVSFRDFVIKGVNGEFYPCKPDIFKKTYEPVDEAEEAGNADENVKALRRMAPQFQTPGQEVIGGAADLIESLQSQLAASQRRERAAVETENRMAKAFALLCRMLDDFAGLPPCHIREIDWPECNGESEQCGDRPIWQCWQKYILEQVDAEPVCRVCGCTQYNACPGGCYWAEPDLCSACAQAGEAVKGDSDA